MNIQKIVHIKSSMPRRKRIAFDKGMTHPVREWAIGLCFFFLVATIGGALSTYTFLRYTDIAVKEATVSQLHTIYNQTLALKALQTYQSRKNDFDAYIHKEVRVVPALLEIASSTPIIPTQNTAPAITSPTQSDGTTGESQLAN